MWIVGRGRAGNPLGLAEQAVHLWESQSLGQRFVLAVRGRSPMLGRQGGDGGGGVLPWQPRPLLADVALPLGRRRAPESQSPGGTKGYNLSVIRPDGQKTQLPRVKNPAADWLKAERKQGRQGHRRACCFLLHVVFGVPVEELARQEGVHPGTMSRWLQRARESARSFVLDPDRIGQ